MGRIYENFENLWGKGFIGFGLRFSYIVNVLVEIVFALDCYA